jgi:UDP-glucose-4-epimerase GalE
LQNKEQQKTILVTGGAGYIGSHVCKALYKKGFLPISYDNLSTGHKYAVKWGPFINADIENRKSLDLAISGYKPIAVMHFAADALVEESVVNPGKYYKNNVAGTINLIEAVKDHGIKNFIFSSSCATYGAPISLPITENHPQNPISPYGKSKFFVEKILEDYEKAHQINFASLRYFNAAGADLEEEIGENHLNETHLIPLVLQAADNPEKEIKIFGNDFHTKDGTAIRDYIHVSDLANAHIEAFIYLLKNKKSLKVNLGTGKGLSVLEIIKAVENICQTKVNTITTKRRDGDPPILIASNTKAKKDLNWSLQSSSIETIIKSAWNWHLKLQKNILKKDLLF